MERSGVLKSRIESPIIKDPEPAASIRNGQEHNRAIKEKKKMKRSWSDRKQNRAPPQGCSWRACSHQSFCWPRRKSRKIIKMSSWCSFFLEFTTNDIGGTVPISRPVIDHPVDLIDYWPPSLLSVEVRSMNGQVIWNSQGDFNALPHLKNGCYYMSLFWDNNAVTRNKFIQFD